MPPTRSPSQRVQLRRQSKFLANNAQFISFLKSCSVPAGLVIVGFDLSRTHSAGVCIRDGSFSAVESWGTKIDKRLAELPRGDFLDECRNWIRGFLSQQVANRAVLIGIEGYAFKMVNRAHTMGEIGGVARASVAHWRRAHPSISLYGVDVAPMSAKVNAAGSKHTDKVSVLRAMRQQFGGIVSDYDEADALSVAWYLSRCCDVALSADPSSVEGTVANYLVTTGLDKSRFA